jgi:8-oxo-dGTP diphosphatase
MFIPCAVRDSTNPRASPSGHLEEGESVIDGAIREAGEEVGVAIDPGDLTFVHAVHYRAPGSEGRIGFFFLTEKWTGDPWNREPAKCARLIWSDPAQPPPAAVPYTAAALGQITQGQPFSLDGWPTPPPSEA